MGFVKWLLFNNGGIKGCIDCHMIRSSFSGRHFCMLPDYLEQPSGINKENVDDNLYDNKNCNYYMSL